MAIKGKTLVGGEDFTADTSWDQYIITTDASNGGNTIVTGNANDTVFAGGGDDTVTLKGGDDFANGEGGNDTIYGGDGRDILVGGSGLDHLYGHDGEDKLYGEDGSDYLYGGNGNDELRGGNNDDFLYGFTGINFIDGGSGYDTVQMEDLSSWGNEPVEVKVDLQFNTATATTLYGRVLLASDNLVNVEWIVGSNSTYGDRLFGNSGDNEISGLDGDDYIDGRDGLDSIWGGAGNDTISGGKHFDEMWGGAGNDTFVFRDNDTGNFAPLVSTGTNYGPTQPGPGQSMADVINDFQTGDRIDLSGIDANINLSTKFGADQAFTNVITALHGGGQFTGPAQLMIQQTFDGSVVFGEVNGDNVVDFAVRVVGHVLTVDDLIL